MRIQVLYCQQGSLGEAVVRVSGGLNSVGCQAQGIVEEVMEYHRLCEDLSLLSNFLKLAVRNLKGYSLINARAVFSFLCCRLP